MKRIYLLTAFTVFIFSASAQHCPWDCTGFLMIKTDATKEEMELVKPVLVDVNKQVVIDTLYGTGKETVDTCAFLEFGDFAKYRKEKEKIHGWYGHDAKLTFAKGHYVVHYNYCKFNGASPQELSIRYMASGHGHHHFISIPADKRIHLHDYNSQLQKNEDEEILKAVEPKIISISRAQWGFQ